MLVMTFLLPLDSKNFLYQFLYSSHPTKDQNNVLAKINQALKTASVAKLCKYSFCHMSFYFVHLTGQNKGKTVSWAGQNLINEHAHWDMCRNTNFKHSHSSGPFVYCLVPVLWQSVKSNDHTSDLSTQQRHQFDDLCESITRFRKQYLAIQIRCKHFIADYLFICDVGQINKQINTGNEDQYQVSFCKRSTTEQQTRQNHFPHLFEPKACSSLCCSSAYCALTLRKTSEKVHL